MNFDHKNLLVLSFTDIDNNQFILTKENLERHQHHPEMRRRSFIHETIKSTLLEPDYIYKSHQKSNCYCFYKKELEINDRVWFTKVIVRKNKKVYTILTAWYTDFMHEIKYNQKPLKKRP